MNEIEKMLLWQARLAEQLTPEGETELALSKLLPPVPRKKRDGAPEDDCFEENAASGGQDEDGVQARAESEDAADRSAAQAALDAFLEGEAMRAQVETLRSAALSQEGARTTERLGVQLSARTPDAAGDGLLGGYETAMTVAGAASTPTTRSMEEISRFFERDARRYGG